MDYKDGFPVETRLAASPAADGDELSADRKSESWYELRRSMTND
jgi:hypothetical protein